MLRSLGRRSLIAPLRSFSSVRQPSYDAVIIGAGVIGTSIATELSRHGWRLWLWAARVKLHTARGCA